MEPTVLLVGSAESGNSTIGPALMFSPTFWAEPEVFVKRTRE